MATFLATFQLQKYLTFSLQKSIFFLSSHIHITLNITSIYKKMCKEYVDLMFNLQICYYLSLQCVKSIKLGCFK
jgi:hypothetical protein